MNEQERLDAEEGQTVMTVSRSILLLAALTFALSLTWIKVASAEDISRFRPSSRLRRGAGDPEHDSNCS